MAEYNQVRFVLHNRDTNTSIEAQVDPKNWRGSQRTIKRSENFGVFTELSRDLEFTKDVALFLRQAYNFRDIEAIVDVEEYREFQDKDGEYLYSVGTLNFTEYTSTENTVTIPFKSGGLRSIVKAQLRNKFEIQRTEALNGNDIGELETKDVALTSRDILLISSLSVSQVSTDQGIGYFSPEMNIVSQSDPRAQSVLNSFVGFNTGGNVWENALPSAINYFYRQATDTFEPVKNITVTGEWDVFIFKSGSTQSILDVALVIFDDNNNYVRHIEVFEETGLSPNSLRSFSINETFEINPNENIVILFNAGTNSNAAGLTNYNVRETNGLTVTENSERTDSQTITVLMHEVGDRLMKIITGDSGRYKSKFYGRREIGYPEDGEFSRTGLSLGLWIRQFFTKRIDISPEEFLETSNAIHNTGYTIQLVNGKETLVHEDMRYFFQNQVVIRLPDQINIISRTPNTDLFNSTMKFGYKKAGDYEEAMGLSEFNTVNNYALPITRVDTDYDKTIDSRADSFGKEFARRKPQLNFPEEDTRYDKDKFILDLKEGLGLALEERVWQDDFETQPTGIFSPDTATGFRLTPFRLMERHSWFFGSGLKKLTDTFIRFTSSFVNTDLSTKKAGEPERREDTNLAVNTLQRVRFCNETVKFQHVVSFELEELINGYTNVMGDEVPNVFFKVEYKNEFSQMEFGYIFELEPDDEGLWTVLKAV